MNASCDRVQTSIMGPKYPEPKRGNPLKITVIGLGRLGAVAAGGLATSGHEVTGLDVDERRVKALQQGRMPFYEPGLQDCLTASANRGSLRFLHSESMTEELSGIALITAGTPAMANGEVDVRQVRATLAWIRSREPRDLVLLMKSTVPPGSGVEFRLKDLKGLDVDYIANPEFLREGRALHDWRYPDRIVLGAESSANKAIDTVREMYSGIESPFLVTDVTSAEMIKYASNAFLAARISFMNEVSSLCDAVGASIDAVSDALAMDARTGAKVFAGVGYGGSCLPKDLYALRHLAASHGLEAGLLREVARVNDRQRRLPVEKLKSRFGDHLEGLQVGVLGLAFKPGTDDTREAGSLELIHHLAERGVRVRAFDPKARAPGSEAPWSSVELVGSVEEVADGAQALVFITEWPEIVGADWERIVKQMVPPRFLFDGRNALEARRMARLGFEYTAVGRGQIFQPDIVRTDENHTAMPPTLEVRDSSTIPQPAAH